MSAFGLTPEPDSSEPKAKVSTDLLADFEPRKVSRPAPDLSESDRAAKAAGFTSREPVSIPYERPTRRNRRPPEQSHPLSIRTPDSILRRFIAYADERNMSYSQALESLLNDSDRLAVIKREGK